jgi:anti-sigma B factor antagonist
MAVPAYHSPPRSVIEGLLSIDIGPHYETCLIRLVGELDASSADALSTELNRLLATATQTILLDLEGLDFIDSVGLQCFVQAARRSRDRGDHLRIVGARGQVRELLTLTGLNTALPLIDDPSSPASGLSSSDAPPRLARP